ncbi:butyrophilin subfamily 1 member A1-like isoform X8 [Ovis aries]|uniref:butyrophilin subfamily 1 member A1-like isoform X7 n=1 Tax=Ovis aries TaxID=9940 RepID=UPI002952853A|nr:butyrophilin subfamily 1 member A1-like isoform X7 [Ovis aries]XP_060259724.1 butyrophilin subfamily 1 member A1-like isoform X8 [Ovis aries]
MYMCVFVCTSMWFTLKHKFFIAFKLLSHFYIVLTLISLFSLSERPAMTVGDLLKRFEPQERNERPQKIFDKKEQGKEDLPPQIEELQKQLDKYKQENEELQKKSEDLQKEIDRRKAQFKLGWRESTLYPDWRKEEFQTVNVTLDEATAHPRLLLTEDRRGVTLQEIQQDLPSSTQRFVSIPCVLGQPQICSGRYYWEVEVGDLHSWDLGVCRDSVSRKGTFQMSPQNGFWAIRLYQEDYWALTIAETHLTLREKPLSVGIFLDYEAGDVSFYNMTDESHIFTFSKQTFYGVLRPLFRLWSPNSGPLTIVQVE